jgi:hypothetical protein
VGSWQTATLEPEFCGQRLSTAHAPDKLQRRWNGLGRRTSTAASRGNVVLFCGLGNHVGLRGLLGGGRSPEKPVSYPRSLLTGNKQGNPRDPGIDGGFLSRIN